MKVCWGAFYDSKEYAALGARLLVYFAGRGGAVSKWEFLSANINMRRWEYGDRGRHFALNRLGDQELE
jgi:hypothetical protein